MIRNSSMALAFVMLSVSNTAWGAFVVDLWNLRTSIQEDIGNPFNSETESITAITNPLFETIHAQVNDNSFSQADFDYAWSPSLATGEFNTTSTHAIRSPGMETKTAGLIRFSSAEDVRVTISGTATYSHTPGDISLVHFAVFLGTANTGEVIFSGLKTGGGFFSLPSTGVLSHFAEFDLPAGVSYKYEFLVASRNTDDLLPTGVIDVSADIRFSVAPVPEPTTALLLTFAIAPFVLRRHRSSE